MRARFAFLDNVSKRREEFRGLFFPESFSSFLFLHTVAYGPQSFTNEQWSLIPLRFCLVFPSVSYGSTDWISSEGHNIKIIYSPTICNSIGLLSFPFPQVSNSICPVFTVIYHMSLSFGEGDWRPPWMFSNQIPRSCTVHWKDRYWIPYFSRSYVNRWIKM